MAEIDLASGGSHCGEQLPREPVSTFARQRLQWELTASVAVLFPVEAQQATLARVISREYGSDLAVRVA